MDALTLAMLKLAVLFAVIIIALKCKLKLFMAIGIAAVLCALLYQIPLAVSGQLLMKTVTSWDTIQVLLILYCITFLQRMLERRSQLKLAQQDLDHIFHNRRINATVAPMLIGLLPSAAAAIICGEIVNEAVGDSLDIDEKATVTSYFRHIPESFLPTYSAIIIMCDLSGVPIGSFFLGMLPLVAVLYTLGYFFYIRKVPRTVEGDPGAAVDDRTKGQYFLQLVKHLWTLIVIVTLIMVFNFSVLQATGAVILVAWFTYRFKPQDLGPLMISAFEKVMITNTFLVYVFKNFLTYTGVVNQLPEFLGRFPVPPFVIFALIFFFGALVAGSRAIITICTPIAFATIPTGGWQLMVLLHSFSYAAMQVSPTHVCLTVVADHFRSSLGGMVKKTAPIIVPYAFIVMAYYLLTSTIF
ncbi:MAG: DUF401 family protein [Solobacterium sp.]|nr:DUF401 family protein [Solobacterium sp.]